ncbi:hypothetical protein BH10ACT9_BH10ACT9_03240 [soil metagenome]
MASVRNWSPISTGCPVDVDVFGGPGAARLAGPPNI